MGSIGQLPEWKQICVATVSQEGILKAIEESDTELRKEGSDHFVSALVAAAAQPDQEQVAANMVSPHPLLVPMNFIESLKELHEALNLAVSNILDRWCEPSDSDDALSRRMPLFPHEEALLQWLYLRTQKGQFKCFHARGGHWRPDVLLSRKTTGDLSFQICEINARFFSMNISPPFQVYRAVSSILTGVTGLRPPIDPDVLLERFCELFDTSRPIHLVLGRDSPSHMEALCHLIERYTGIRPRIVTVSDLRLIPDMGSATGYKLCTLCRTPHNGNKVFRNKDNGGFEELEEIYQVGLRLYQDEFGSLSAEMLQHLAIYSMNDMRAILLLGDKRILGIILQELDDLVSRYQVLTPDQARLLREHIVPTILPGSPQLERLVCENRAGKVRKEDYVIKPCREARSIGISFGDELSPSEWDSLLASMQDPRLHSHKTQYVLQPVVGSPSFKALLDKEGPMREVNVVGEYHVFDGRFSHSQNPCQALAPSASGLATANTRIRAALLSVPNTQNVHVAGVGTTKTGYFIRFKGPESAETARNNTEWLN
ncbi:hypothetical protein CNMCM7691_008624 [Aspergillus felis]|uniref:Uncharacterized protein n=1 Tax=Aspergillus felis TaxID=1287682 RepID=A0A8H6QUK2_9EURO|nr:hypothetical protein CNMCM7691_008624 [Aspergillus felis]